MVDAKNESPPFQSLAPQVIKFEIVAGSIFSGVVFIALTVGLLTLWLSVGPGWMLASAAVLALLILATLLWLTFIWPAKSYRHTKWKLDDEGLEIHRGVIWRQRISIPLGRVQHADVSQGPLQRPFGLGKLTVHTAGTQNASVDLDGLSHELALELRDRLVRQTGAHDVT